MDEAPAPDVDTVVMQRNGEDFVSDRARIEGSTASSTASSGARGGEQSSAASARASAMRRLVVLRFTRAMAALPCSAYAKAVLRGTVEGPRHYDNAKGETKGTGVRASQKNAFGRSCRIGLIVVGMARHGYDLALTSDEHGWRATFLHHDQNPSWVGICPS